MAWEPAEDFGTGGRKLFDSLSSANDDATTGALVVEAARTKDRLDRLNRLTSGDEDAWCRVFEAEGELVLKIDGALAEQRQLTTVFRQLLSEIQRRQGDRGAGDEEDGLAGL